MINGQRVLAVIPARGGSKGIPRKNIRPFCGQPLLAWSLAAAKESRYVDRTVLSSEDEEIISTFLNLGGDVPFRRPSALAMDDTPGTAPLLHACEQLPGYDWVVLLQPTSPLRLASDIDACIEACVNAGAYTATTVVEDRHGLHLFFNRDAQGYISPAVPQLAEIQRRQEAPLVWRMNGAVYVAKISKLLTGEKLVSDSTIGVAMPESRSVDIDSLEDFELAEWYASRGQRNQAP
jgi:CMP-N,N'-diacetyllegionaminic acid synthase